MSRYEQRCAQQLCVLRENKRATILAIETSCDETAAAVVRNGREVLSNVLYSQIDIHKEYGGVVPEIASRNHLEKLPYIVAQALERANQDFADVDAIAVTAGPGLVGALLTGVSYAKALAYGADKPLIAVNHIEGHISANYISSPGLAPPFVCLVVSGGHTELISVRDYASYVRLGSTRDDAAGEAFDKVARVLGLEYPGGPNLQRLAAQGDASKYAFPQSFRGQTHLDFSFSGLKTAVIHLLHKFEQTGEPYRKEDVSASFQKAAVDALLKNAFEALRREKAKALALAGGVSANGLLREQAAKRAQGRYELYLPALCYCTDNAAMIGSAAFYRLMQGAHAGLSLNANPGLALYGMPCASAQ